MKSKIRALSIMIITLSLPLAYGEQTDLTQIMVSSNIPASMMLAQLPLTSLAKARVRNDLSDTIRTQELAYAWYWLAKAIRPEMLAGLRQDDLRCISGVGRHADDAITASWSSEGFQYLLVDSRFLTLSIRCPQASNDDVSQIFQKIAPYNHGCIERFLKMQCEDLSPKDAPNKWGRIVIDRGRAGMWFDLPIEWYRDGDVIIFTFEKVLKHPNSKGFTSDITQIVGGSPIDDMRPYLRFENNDRRQLAEDYAVKLKLREKFMADFAKTWGKVPVMGQEIVRTTNDPPNPSSK